jgi:hypothetical protein
MKTPYIQPGTFSMQSCLFSMQGNPFTQPVTDLSGGDHIVTEDGHILTTEANEKLKIE